MAMLRRQIRFPDTGAAPTLVLIYLTVLIALGACGGEQTPTSTATNVPAGPTATTVPSPTPEPTTVAQPGATRAPADTPSPELTRIPIATLTQKPALDPTKVPKHLGSPVIEEPVTVLHTPITPGEHRLISDEAKLSSAANCLGCWNRLAAYPSKLGDRPMPPWFIPRIRTDVAPSYGAEVTTASLNWRNNTSIFSLHCTYISCTLRYGIWMGSGQERR